MPFKNIFTATSTALLILLLVLIATATTTFLAISGHLSYFAQKPDAIAYLLIANVTLLAVLCLLIARHIYHSWKRLKSGIKHSRLQRNIVLSFCLVTALPTIIVSVFSALFFNLGVQAWFNDRVTTAVEESMAVAEAYLDEHRENIRLDALAMAADINRFYSAGLVVSTTEFNRFISLQAARRQLTEVVVFQRDRIIAQGRLSFALAFETLSMDVLNRAADGEVIVTSQDENEDKVRALTRVDAIDEGYLMIGRLVDDQVIRHMENTQGAVNAYRNLREQLSTLQWTFSLVFIMLSLALLLASIWYGLVFAARLTLPISQLAIAAERVRAGDYSTRVKSASSNDEIGILSRAFNRMVDQLDAQRHDLISANRELDDRRRFSEAVLGGVSAGVIALEADRTISLSNRSAAAALANDRESLKGRSVSEVFPGIQELLMKAEQTRGEVAQGTLHIETDNNMRTLHARVVAEYNGEELGGYIVTFDDITPLVAAQRDAAWSDVARRVAHEIKNPLTPITLSAERLKRKYLGQIKEEEAESFNRYIDTIIRHVTDIGRMVEEFVAFARMPTAVMKQADMVQLLRRVVFSEQVAHPTIAYEMIADQKTIPFNGDEHQISQVMSNLLKNAAEAIEGDQAEKLRVSGAGQGQIAVHVMVADEFITIRVEDNGPGFPPDKIHTMLEPYVTTRAKGTGLGLAIAKKVVEEHGGKLTLANREEGGGVVMLSFLQHCDIKASMSNTTRNR